MVDITHQVQETVTASGIKEGICVVYVPHTTAAVTVNEGADPMVCEDILSHLSKMIPHGGNYHHLEGNADAHIKVAEVGSSELLIVSQGMIQLGTWQRVFLCEFDGPRSRNVWIQVVGA